MFPVWSLLLNCGFSSNKRPLEQMIPRGRLKKKSHKGFLCLPTLTCRRLTASASSAVVWKRGLSGTATEVCAARFALYSLTTALELSFQSRPARISEVLHRRRFWKWRSRTSARLAAAETAHTLSSRGDRFFFACSVWISRKVLWTLVLETVPAGEIRKILIKLPVSE